MRTRVGGVVAAVVMAALLAACGGAQNSTRQQLASYLARVNTLERRLDPPVATIDQVDRQLTARVNRRSGSGSGSGSSDPPAGGLTVAAAERSLSKAVVEIRGVSARLQALSTPAPAARLRTLLVTLADRQADLAVQTGRLIVFIPGLARALEPLPPAVRRLERVLTVQQASGAAAVSALYARKAGALRSFGATLTGILGSLDRLVPPASSRPTYVTERRSLSRMRTAASSLAGDLASGRTTTLGPVLQSFDRAAALPGSLTAQRAERAAVRVYDRQVTGLDSLVASADRQRAALAQRYR